MLTKVIYSITSNTIFEANTARNTIEGNVDSRKYTGGIFIDLKNAFDTVHHSILLAKLESYSIRGIVNTWFQSYLASQKKTVEIGKRKLFLMGRKPSVVYSKTRSLDR